MPTIMPVAQWMSLTDGGFTKARSTQLLAIDTALVNYHRAPGEASLLALQQALINWVTWKGAGWKTSVRNKRHGIETLYIQAIDIPQLAKNGAGMVAISHARDESRAIVSELFLGQTLMFRKQKLTKTQKALATLNIRAVATNSAKLAGTTPKALIRAGADGVRSGLTAGVRATGLSAPSFGSSDSPGIARRIVQEIVGELSPAAIRTEVTNALAAVMPDFLVSLAKAITPCLGLLVSGGGVVYSTIKTIRAQYRVDMAEDHIEGSLSTAEPAVALAALVRMLERERNDELTGLTIGATEFGSKVAGALIDGGTTTTVAIGLGASIAKLALLVRLIVRDIQEKNAVNTLLAQGRIDLKIFDACPLVGAYMVCCSPTSVLVNTIFDNFYEHGMQDKVELAVSVHLAPLREQARRLIADHRMHFPHLRHYPGVLAKNEKKLKEMKKKKGKTEIGKSFVTGQSSAPATS